MALADKLNAACADAPIRKVAAQIAKAENWNDRTGGIEGIHLDCHAVRVLHAYLQHHLALPNTEVRHARASADAAPSVGPSHENP